MCFGQVTHTLQQVEHSKLFANYGLKSHKLTEGQLEDQANNANLPQAPQLRSQASSNFPK